MSPAPAPCAAIASGMRSSSATEIMKPADSAMSLSSADMLHCDRDVTAAAPTTFAAAAISVYAIAGRITPASMRAVPRRRLWRQLVMAPVRDPRIATATNDRPVLLFLPIPYPAADKSIGQTARKCTAPAALSDSAGRPL